MINRAAIAAKPYAQQKLLRRQFACSKAVIGARKSRSAPVFKTFGENGGLEDLSMETGCSSSGQVGPHRVTLFLEKKKLIIPEQA